MTYAAYLVLEQTTGTKHEYLNGEAWAMSGGTAAHAKVVGNVVRALGNALEGTPCVEYPSELKVRIEATGLSTYPDVCGPLEHSPADAHAATNPTLLVEIISPSTESWDTGGKFLHYGRIPLLREVLYVWPGDQRIQLRSSNDDGSWTMRDIPLAENVTLRSVCVTITRAAIFARLEHAI